jgi:RNA polymerase sigma-70 factor (ECF subfamily)
VIALPAPAESTDIAAGPETLAAFERAYEDCWTPVFRLALAWTNDWCAAEDITQEAFARIWRNRARVDWPAGALPWLLTTTRRLATDRFRRLRTRIAYRSPGGPELDPDARARWLDVSSAFGRLSPLERAALALNAVAGFTSEEAASTLGTSPAAVRAAVFRARRKLEEA